MKDFDERIIYEDDCALNKSIIVNSLPTGWHSIVSELIDDLFNIGWDGELHQAKEKFGCLQFCVRIGNDDMFDLIASAEEETRKVCIVCGEPATGTTKGWFTYRCDEHLEGNTWPMV